MALAGNVHRARRGCATPRVAASSVAPAAHRAAAPSVGTARTPRERRPRARCHCRRPRRAVSPAPSSSRSRDSVAGDLVPSAASSAASSLLAAHLADDRIATMRASGRRGSQAYNRRGAWRGSRMKRPAATPAAPSARTAGFPASSHAGRPSHHRVSLVAAMGRQAMQHIGIEGRPAQAS